jgi:hypothetical protein
MTNLPVPTAPWTALDPRRETAAARHVRRNLRRLLVTTAADHLERAAAALRQAATIDGLVLAGHRTAEVLGALRLSADQLGAQPLPAEVAAAVPELRRWTLLLKDPLQPLTAQSPGTSLTGRRRKLTH